MTKSSGGGLAERVPLRQRSTNTQLRRDDAGQQLQKPSQLVDPQASKKENVDPVEIEELRKKPNGEGYTVHRYARGKMLGKGGFAKVYLCTSLDTNRSYAVKIVPKANLVKSRARQKLQAEIKIHRSLKHKHVCEYKHFFEDKTNCYILLELCHNQSMNELLKRRKRLTEPEVKYYLTQLLDSTQYMHSVNVIHRDLKLGNLFLDKNLRIKVGDFGLATKLTDKDEKRKTICGTPNYIAPEVIEGDKEKRGHSFEVDIWSIGVICYTLLVGKPPYESKDVKSTYQRILRNEYSFPSHVPISDYARDLISRMLQTRPENRPDLDTIFAHPFFTHDPKKIPRSLPPCCTHVAPDWQEDREGYLVPVLAEADEHQNYGPLPSSTKSSNHNNALTGKVNAMNDKENVNQRAASNNKFEIYSETSSQRTGLSKLDRQKSSTSTSNIKSVDREFRQGSEDEHLPQNQQRNDSMIENMRKMTIGKGDNISPAKTGSLESPTSSNDDDARALQCMYARLKEFGLYLESNSKAPVSSKPAQTVEVGRAEKWVTRYVDYTSKYGLGFLFNDGSAGVYFNDSTKVVLQPNSESFIYVDRNKSTEGITKKSELIPQCYTLSDHPDSLQKKVTLLKHFRNYLIEQQKRDDEEIELSSNIQPNDLDENSPPVFLKKWVRTNHAILFRLSNQTIQIVFYDHTEILLTSEARIVMYVNKKNERESYCLEDIMVAGDHADIKKRLKYSEGILKQLVSYQKK
eukprot:CAMPEP_0176492430 /NCGR_PEP_ID=MMETSP0200_2-20121128/8992_1 /TAXON_ID=947934 /ORGANISM="Chaetoceros sp., Strain GSL56" /LENGTH=743 /DNA_ID=CAMNT_0017889987 /DNA_START=590 /DNA_END=2821 /DNA_ORIENTATION=-